MQCLQICFILLCDDSDDEPMKKLNLITKGQSFAINNDCNSKDMKNKSSEYKHTYGASIILFFFFLSYTKLIQNSFSHCSLQFGLFVKLCI